MRKYINLSKKIEIIWKIYVRNNWYKKMNIILYNLYIPIEKIIIARFLFFGGKRSLISAVLFSHLQHCRSNSSLGAMVA